MSKDKKTERTEDDDILIEYPQVVVGMYLSRQNAKRQFDDAKFLYNNSKFQSAIPIFILSLEEALKSHELSIKFRKQQHISKKDWVNLQQHKHKLNYIADFVIENMESMNDETAKDIAKELGQEEFLSHRSEILNLNKGEKSITIHFQFLKERCLYQNWNEEFKEWDDFEHLDSNQKENLAYFVMKRAEIQLGQLDLAIELSVRVIRRDWFMIKDLEFPKYNDLRDPKNFETKIDHNIVDDYFKYHKGLGILESLIVKKAFAVIDQIQTHGLIGKCLKLAKKSGPDNWCPHPAIKSIFLAMAIMGKAGKDGKYAGLSGDGDQTISGNPIMYSMSGVSIQKGILKVDVIMINGENYSADDKIIEQILQTEMIIDAIPGKTIPLEKMHAALAEVGLKMRKLKDIEIEPAIKNAISMVEHGHYQGISDEIMQKIKQVTKKNWDYQDPTLRSMIGSAFARNIVKDENTIIMTGQYDPLEKFKVRGMILQMLLSRNELNMRTE